MLQNRTPIGVGEISFVHRLRFELAFVIVFGVFLPVWFGLIWNFQRAWTSFDLSGARLQNLLAEPTWNSFLGAVAAAFGATIVLRRFRNYPGTAVAESVLPLILAFYGAFAGTVIFFRIEYSIKISLLCFIATVLARFAVETLHFRLPGRIYCLVPGGEIKRVRQLERPLLIDLPETPPAIGDMPRGAIIADVHAHLDPAWEKFLAEAAISGRSVYHYKQVVEAETGRVQINHLSENEFGSLVPSLVYQKLKRSVDIVACLILLPVVLPIMLVTAVLVRLDSVGPVFFRQQRMGFRGRPFWMIKFRTMTETNDGADKDSSITHQGDLRITRVGRFLRPTRLDELPQIFNILRGQMSWIGPRPEAVSLSGWYEGEIPFYRYRHIVRPGITGWAQVNQGHVASVSEVDYKLQYDFYYIKHLSYWLDIVIALRTLRVMLSGFGAR
ncbi:exopolysaccharide biosynthesis polyprenyl glycosylphosphotransferase [Qipengyuania citrea]|uniref:exopolysaccharide biosynthesis polyprenyl glycosylphosphotransferase n=1 Tax=Qipengyuania citrea TaxID=225971 RepID=UPI003299E5DF